MAQLALWGVDPSPPTRAIRMLLKELELDYEFKRVNILEREHYTSEMGKHSPKPTIPALQDGEIFLFDSHAIATYVVDKYAKSDNLYPKDLAKRAQVDRILFVDAGVLFNAVLNIVGPFFYKKQTLVQEEKLENVLDAYQIVETLLQDNDYLAGDQLTIGDISCLSTVKTLDVFLPMDAEKFPKVGAWLQRMHKLPYVEEINEPGLNVYRTMVKPQLTYIWN